MRYFIGVDIGLKGAITVIDENNNIIICEPTPITEIIVNKKKKNQYDIKEINSLLKRIFEEYKITEAIMERLRSFPGQSSQTGFSLGYGVAIFKTLFTVYGIPYREVEAREWQQNIFKGINYTKDTTKEASIMVANRLAPGFSFKSTEKCKKDSDGMTDSYCMAIYLKRIYK